MDEEKPQSWWKTLPGILTATAGFITAVSGLVLALHQAGIFEKKGLPTPEPKSGQVRDRDQPQKPPVEIPRPVPKAPPPVEPSGLKSPPPPAPAGFPAAMLQYFPGVWENIDPATRGITKLKIRASGSELFVQAWGKCVPNDCDWGEVKAEKYYVPKVKKGMMATYRGSDIVKIHEAQENNTIRVDYESGRVGSKHAYVLRRR
jgi:hypothetical protein